jgi:glucokinase
LRNWQVIVGNSPVVLGFDFGGTKIAIAVCDLMGNRLASATVSTGAAPGVPQPVSDDGAQAIFDRGIRAARDLLASAAPQHELAAVGAATFGIPFEDRVELAPAIDGWESFALGRELRAAFEGAEIRMATDAKAAAAAELRWGTLTGCDPGVYLNLGTGLATAIVVGGQVVSGGNGGAGEIGYNLRAVSDVGLTLDQRVPLEGAVSGLGLARRAADPGSGGPGAGGPGTGGPGAGGPGPDGPGPDGPGRPGNAAVRPMTAADIFEASPDDPELDDLVASFVTELAFHVVNLAICINPVRISVGGGMVRSWERLRPHLEHALNAGVPFPPELVVARFPFDAPLLGAIALAVDAADAIGARTFGPEDQDHRLDTANQIDQENMSQDIVALDSTA